MLLVRDCTTDAIHHVLLAQYAIDEDDDLREAVGDVLSLLDRLGVIQVRA